MRRLRTWPILALLLLVMGCNVALAGAAVLQANDGKQAVLTVNSETATNLVTEQTVMTNWDSVVWTEQIEAMAVQGIGEDGQCHSRSAALTTNSAQNYFTRNDATLTMASSTDLVVMEDISAQRLLGSTEWLQNSDLNLLDFNATAETIVMAGQAACLNDAVAILTTTNLSSKSTEQGAVAINAASHNFSSDRTLANLVGYDDVVIKCMMAADSWSHRVQAAIGA